MIDTASAHASLENLMQFCKERNGNCSKCPLNKPCDNILGLSLFGLCEDMCKELEP